MNIFSSELLQAIVQAPFVEQVTTDENNYVIYMCFPKGNDFTKCQIRQITYTKSGNSETYETKYPLGSKAFEFNRADRLVLIYEYYR